MIYNGFNREISCHLITASLCQSDICLAPCHQTSQSFDLPSTTVSPHHRIITAPHHYISQSFALPPATKPVSHLPCPLPPNQSVICLTPATKPVSHLTCPLPPCHCITTSPHEIFPTTWVWIWLVNTTQHSSDWLIVPTTANQITGIEKPNYHKTLIFFPTTSLKRSHEARIDELADSNEPANVVFKIKHETRSV